MWEWFLTKCFGIRTRNFENACICGGTEISRGCVQMEKLERYCGPMPVITLKQSVEMLYCIRVLIGFQCNDWRMGWTWVELQVVQLRSELSTICQWVTVDSQRVGSCSSPSGTEWKHRLEFESLEQWVNGVWNQFVWVQCMLICRCSIHADPCLSCSQVWHQVFSQKEQNALQNFQSALTKEEEN